MKIKIIIPILNPPVTFFKEMIPALLNQTIRPEILLINSGLTIPSGEYEVLDIDPNFFNHANTRNLAMNYQSYFYLFMTQDAMPCDDTLIENLLEAFEDPDTVVAYAQQIPYPNADAIEIFARTTNYPNYSCVKTKNDLATLGIKTFFSSDSCAMYRENYFKSIGGFKKDTNTSEDMEFAARAIINNKKVAYTANAKVYHSHNFTLAQIWQRYQEIGKFFAYNQWILETVAQYKSTESTGILQALRELRYLIRYAPLSIPRSIVLSITKYIAFKSSF